MAHWVKTENNDLVNLDKAFVLQNNQDGTYNVQIQNCPYYYVISEKDISDIVNLKDYKEQASEIIEQLIDQKELKRNSMNNIYWDELFYEDADEYILTNYKTYENFIKEMEGK